MKADRPVPTSPAPLLHKGPVIALIAIATAYSLLDGQFRFGPRWLPIPLVSGLLLAILAARWLEMHALARKLAFTLVGTGTAAIAASVAVLLRRLINGDITAPNLLRDAALLWLANIVVFSMWYWEIDGGGPQQRHMEGYRATDFVFPQTALSERFGQGWMPGYIDYLFVAFNSSSAFSPTDTLVLSQRAKVLMMAQALISISTLTVLAARAVNTLR
jgi:hypothetical protein